MIIIVCKLQFKIIYKFINKPWLVRLSGLTAGLRIKDSLLGIPAEGTCVGCRPGPQ